MGDPRSTRFQSCYQVSQWQHLAVAAPSKAVCHCHERCPEKSPAVRSRPADPGRLFGNRSSCPGFDFSHFSSSRSAFCQERQEIHIILEGRGTSTAGIVPCSRALHLCLPKAQYVVLGHDSAGPKTALLLVVGVTQHFGGKAMMIAVAHLPHAQTSWCVPCSQGRVCSLGPATQPGSSRL